jgi:hypothetical protein
MFMAVTDPRKKQSKGGNVYFGSWIQWVVAVSIVSGPVVMQSIMVEGIVEQRRSPYRSWEMETEKEKENISVLEGVCLLSFLFHLNPSLVHHVIHIQGWSSPF